MSVRFVFMSEAGLNFGCVSSPELISQLNPTLSDDSYKIISDEEFDSLDKEFLHAYELDSEFNFVMNIEKAKELQKSKLRNERKSKLEKLDTEFIRAVESGDEAKKTEIVGKKQILRDITSLVDIATTLDEIKLIKVKDFSGLICTGEDLQAAGFCMDGTKEWFQKMGWDFKDYIKNGKPSEDLIATNDPLALSVVEAAYNRTNK